MEEQLIQYSFYGVFAVLLTGFAPRKVSRYLSTLLSIGTLLVVSIISIEAKGIAGIVGLVSSTIGIASILSAHELVEENISLHDALIVSIASLLPILLLSDDLVRMFIAWETISISIVLLTAFHRDEESSEAALKYLTLCGVASLIALLGISLVYFETGSLVAGKVAEASLLAKILILIGFGAEAALFPLHFWLPDAHMAAPSPGSAVLSGIAIETACLLVYRLLGRDPTIAGIVIPLAVVGAFVGNFSAYRQVDMKRLLAYSSIANVSYIMLGLFSMNKLAQCFAVLHVAAHGFLKAGLFILSGLLLAESGTRRLDLLQGSLSSRPLLKTIFILAALGLTGAPPTLTFWSELYLIVGLSQASWILAILLALAIITSFGYYFALIYNLSIKSTPQTQTSITSKRKFPLSKLSIILLVLSSVALFFFYQNLSSFLG